LNILFCFFRNLVNDIVCDIDSAVYDNHPVEYEVEFFLSGYRGSRRFDILFNRLHFLILFRPHFRCKLIVFLHDKGLNLRALFVCERRLLSDSEFCLDLFFEFFFTRRLGRFEVLVPFQHNRVRFNYPLEIDISER